MTRAMLSKMEEFLIARQAAERTDLGIRLAAVIGAVILVAAAGALISPVNDLRRETQMVLDEETLRGLPPDVALLTKTGTLRALAIDMAFVRLEHLKEHNRFYELMQLSDWLCKLAPRYPTVWQYSAWNMAYNISVCQYSPEARWLWVQNGINNLRNRGLRFNPKNISLYKELAMIFWHKIGDMLDDYHWEYKKELAVQMEVILGEPPLAVTAEHAVDALREIRDAPRNVQKLITEDPAVANLVARLREVGLGPDKSLLAFVARHLGQVTRISDYALEEDQGVDPNSQWARGLAVLRNPENAETVKLLINSVRATVIDRELNMDLEWMVQLMEDYGPIDWRTPFAHSLYWSTYGDMVTKGVININPHDSMNTVRFIFFSLENLCRRGRVVLEPNFDRPNRSFLQMFPDSRFIKHMHAAYLKYGQEQFGDDPRFRPGTSGPNYWAGHKNLLTRSIQQLYFEGGQKNVEEAKEYFFYLWKYDREDNGEVKARYKVAFERFVLDGVFEALDTQKASITFISELLIRSLKDLGDNDAKSSLAHFNQARKAWNYYQRDVDTDRNPRRKLDPIIVMRADAAVTFMARPVYSVLQKARVWKNLDTPTRQYLYDKARPWIEQYCAAHEPPLDPERVMPPPPGLEEHRKDPDAVLRRLERLDQRLSTGEKQDSD